MLEPLKLLISDEDPDRRVATRRSAQRAGLDVAAEVGYGTQAVSVAADIKPNIILLAVEEPVGRPLETAEALGNVLPDTPIIIYSSINESRAIRRAMVLGARDYISQPVQAASLKEAVSAVLIQEKRRQMQRSGELLTQQGRGTVVTVAGGKGGIGKSVVCVNLAVTLRRETGRKVVIFDADTQLGDVGTMLDITPQRTVEDLIPHVHHLDRNSIDEFLTVHDSGLAVLAASGSEGVWEGWTTEGLRAIIDALARNYDFVLIDTAGTFDRFARTCIEASTLTVVVTTGEVSSVRDTGVGLRRMASWGISADRFKVVLSQAGRAKGVSTQDVAKALGQEIFWEVPYDKRVPMAVQMGQPVTLFDEKSPAARSLGGLARVIAGTNKPLAQQAKRPLNQAFVNQILRTARSRS
jgi:pilus assembly protein CpaE